MDTRKTRTWAEVSLGALRHNVEEMQRALPDGCGLLGVVKADAYGHGASEIAAALRECGCRYLAVACPQEALALRQAGETMPILILGAVDAAFASDMAANDITLSVECAEKGRALSAALRGGERLRIHLKLDTGMGRLGFRVQDETARGRRGSTAAESGRRGRFHPLLRFRHARRGGIYRRAARAVSLRGRKAGSHDRPPVPAAPLRQLRRGAFVAR